jgi:S-adenosylmethionine:tRNA ribosyltransferase-isomerase
MAEIDQYDYELPRERIAQRPLSVRSDARLLVVRRDLGTWEHSHVRNLPEFLEPADCLVLNDTRVIPARLVGYRTNTKGRWTGLFLSADEAGNWQVLSKTRGKLSAGETITLVDRQHHGVCRLMLLSNLGGGQWAARPDGRDSTLDLLERVGRVPLPPYIRDGEMVDDDQENYQTVFAEKPEEAAKKLGQAPRDQQGTEGLRGVCSEPVPFFHSLGSVAAPTAGLHFTEDLLQRIRNLGVEIHRVTLHVGLGTFRPVSVDRLSDHKMHSEWASLDAPTADRLNQIRAAGGRLIAVGTTVVRTLESVAAEKAPKMRSPKMGQAPGIHDLEPVPFSDLKMGQAPDIRDPEAPKMGQAPGIRDPEAPKMGQAPGIRDLESPKMGQAPGIRDLEPVPFSEWQGETDLFIRPPYQFRAIDALMTNFHLPKSTLLVLVRTFGGDDLIRRAYEEAIREEYRFFSYGDAMLIL